MYVEYVFEDSGIQYKGRFSSLRKMLDVGVI